MKLWLGVPPKRSGVFSAGNGPAMRAAIFGAAIDNRDTMLRMVRASSCLTHIDPKAEWGAVAVALAAREAREQSNTDAQEFIDTVVQCLGGEAVGAERTASQDSTERFRQ